MKKLFIFLTIQLTLYCCLYGIEGNPLCNAGWKYFEHSCYKFESKKLNWTDSQKQCKKLGADLVKISSQAENDFVYNNRKGSNVWIGLHRGSDHKFRWVDGTILGPNVYSNWGRGEPNNNHEKCGHMWSNVRLGPGTWNDAVCHAKITYVCEKKRKYQKTCLI